MNSSRLLFFILSLLCLPLTSHVAHADFLTYNDRATFNANSTGLINIEFETAPPNGSMSYNTGSMANNGSATFNNVTFTGNNLFTIDPGLTPPQYDYNSGDTFFSNALNSSVTVTLPTNITAVGFDFMNRDNGNAGVSGAFEFVVNGQTFNGTTGARPNRAFFGFTSDTAITSFSYRSLGGSNFPTDRALIDNFSFGTAAVMATPEPETWAMMLLGMGALGFMTWKRKRNEPQKSSGFRIMAI